MSAETLDRDGHRAPWLASKRQPTLVPEALRRRVIAELGVLACASTAYLVLMPKRPVAFDALVAAVALVAVGLTANETRGRVCGRPTAPSWERLRRCTREMVLITAPVALLFGGYGAVSAYVAGGQWGAVVSRLFPAAVLLTLGLYIPWAWLQQTLFQFYLLGRLRAVLPLASPFALSCVSGILFGAVHVPAYDVVVAAMVGGVVWSWSYQRHRSLLPISVSHAVLATTYFHWVRGAGLMVSL